MPVKTVIHEVFGLKIVTPGVWNVWEWVGLSHGCGHPAWSTIAMKLWNYVIWIWHNIFGFAWCCLLIVSVTYVRYVSVFYRMSAFLRRSSMWYLGFLNWTIVDGNFDYWEDGKSAAFFATNPPKKTWHLPNLWLPGSFRRRQARRHCISKLVFKHDVANFLS